MTREPTFAEIMATLARHNGTDSRSSQKNISNGDDDGAHDNVTYE